MSEVQSLPVAEADYKWPDDELVVRLSDYDALAAECERLRAEAANIRARWTDYGREVEAQRDAALAELAALKGGQAKDETHAQPEVAQNTGSQAMANNQLQRQGRAAGHGVEAVAAVNEASEASDIFAWATFDGEGSYELRLYENNESYQDEWLARESAKYAGWVFPLYTSPPAQASAWPEGAARSDTWLEKWARDKFNSTGRYKGRVYGNTDWALARALHTAMLAAAPTPGASDGKGGDHE